LFTHASGGSASVLTIPSRGILLRPMRHESHADIIKRLKRARGQIDALVGMLAEGRDCALIAQQLHALERAVASAKRTLIHDHIDHCLSESTSAREHGHNGHSHLTTAKEFKEITKYL
jgi:uncharacterized protein